jgi:hypothetical protein
MPRFSIALFAVLLSGLPPLAAQTAPKTAPAAAVPLAHVDPTRIAPYHHSLRIIKTQGGEDQQIGTLDDRVVIGEDNGKPAIIRVQNVDGQTGAMLDSAVADPASLAPRWHSSHSERRILRLEFTPGHVTGSFWEQGDPSFPIDDKPTVELFDSNMLDVLIAALPLAAGYAGRLNVYLYEAGGPVPVDVAVTGSETVGGTDTWVTAVTLNQRTARYYVGKTQHRVEQIISVPAPGIEIKLVSDG